MILIISNKTDLATDYLVHYLSEKKIKYVRLNTEDFQLKWEVNFDISSKGSEVIIHRYSDNYKLSTTMIYGAYIRQPQLPDLNLSNSDKEFGMREVGETLKSLWRVIPEKIWLNAPHNILRASNKPEQLQIAKSVGFNIPNTCITSNIEKIYSFYQSNNQQIIAKAVKHGFQYDGYKAKVVATQKLNSKQLSTIKNFAKVPMIFQEFIEKNSDIRVTVVGDRVFATEISSQEFQETSTDWRLSDYYEINLEHKIINLPVDIEAACIKITRHFNLKFSAIDLIYSLDKAFYFLEMNPNGQWAWIEQITKQGIRKAITSELIKNEIKNA